MDIEILEKKYISFKNGIEGALRLFTKDISKNVKGMREEINTLKEDMKNFKLG